MGKSKDKQEFADTYIGCQVVANIMGLNVETVRRRVKAGKIPAKQDARGGTWVFTHADLVAAGIHPFKSAPVASGSVAKDATNYTHVVFVLDRSGSMARFDGEVRKSLVDQVEELRKGLGPSDRYSMSVINFNDSVSVTVPRIEVTAQDPRYPGQLYLSACRTTALYDAISKAIDLAIDSDDGRRAVLVSILTDGLENGSHHSTEESVASRISAASRGGRFTFAYAGPPGSEHYAFRLGIPSGNVTTWEQTQEGFIQLNAQVRSSLNTYTESRSRGVLRSESFYAQPVTADPAAFAGKLDAQLDDVTNRVRVERVIGTGPLKIADFGLSAFGAFTKGELYYELTESEKVQDYKGIIVQDRTRGLFYSGWAAAKKLLGLPAFRGTVRIRPGSLGDFKVFVQSTSLNRKLVPGTAVIKLGA